MKIERRLNPETAWNGEKCRDQPSNLLRLTAKAAIITEGDLFYLILPETRLA